MSTPHDPKVDLLHRTAEFYRRSLADYAEFARTERKPRTKRQLEKRLQAILEEIEALKHESV